MISTFPIFKAKVVLYGILKLVQKLLYLTLNHGLSSEVLTQPLILLNQLWNKKRSYTSPLDLLLLCHAAFLEFLTATTWTGVIPSNLWICLFWLRRVKKPLHFRYIFSLIWFYFYHRDPAPIITHL